MQEETPVNTKNPKNSKNSKKKSKKAEKEDDSDDHEEDDQYLREWLTDRCICRYLRARDFDLQKSFEMLVNICYHCIYIFEILL